MKLSEEFINKYKNIEPPMTPLGQFVYYRTYSRFLPEKNRREYWWETCRRAVEYNCSLVTDVSEDEAEQLFDLMFYLKVFLSGRTLWVGGTESSNKYPSSNYNCSFTNIEKIDDICEVFYLLLLGCGVGFKATEEHCIKLPKFNTNIEVIHKEYDDVTQYNKERKEYTGCGDCECCSSTIVIGDSKEGWVEALRTLLILMTCDNEHSVVINYDNVRPEGSPLKTFGGYASGHKPLKNMIEKIVDIIKNSENGKLKTIDVLDICTLLGQAVQVGGVRRSAEVCLFDKNDNSIRTAKQDLTPDFYHRFSSNNSILFTEKPSYQELKELFETIKTTGEPGFVNGQTALRRFSDFEGVNPCVEILLPSKGFCNLVEVNVMGFAIEGIVREAHLMDAIKIATRASYRMACVDIELPEWKKIQEKNMLLGVSLSGWQDAMNLSKYDKEHQSSLLNCLRIHAQREGAEYANNLKRNKPKLITTEKPSGTLSLLPTVSSGVHYSHSPYYIRRVRINAGDPLVKVCEEQGLKVVPEVGQTEENCNTKVIEFYVKSPEGKTKENITAIEQLEVYKMFMDNYVDHNTSVTVTIKENEWDDVVDWVYNNWDSFVGISFLPHYGGVYELAPLESITKEVYDKNYKEININPEIIAKYELNYKDDDNFGDIGCSNGVCPVR